MNHKETKDTKEISKATIAGLLLALTLLLSAPALKYGFVYEDHLLIEDNLDIRQFNFTGAFKSSVGYTGDSIAISRSSFFGLF